MDWTRCLVTAHMDCRHSHQMFARPPTLSQGTKSGILHDRMPLIDGQRLLLIDEGAGYWRRFVIEGKSFVKTQLAAVTTGQRCRRESIYRVR